MTDHSNDCEPFLADLRALDAPPRGARDEVRARLTEKLGDVWDEAPSTSGAARSPRSRALGRSLAIGLVGGALAMGIWQLERSRSSGPEQPATSASSADHALQGDGLSPPASRPSAAAAQEEPIAPPQVSVDALPAAQPRREKVDRRPASPMTTQAAVEDDGRSLAEEARLVRSAHASLRRGDGADALALLDEHARAFPKGVLRQERNGERVLALCAVGRRQEARELARAFLREEPASSLAERVRASCGGEP